MNSYQGFTVQQRHQNNWSLITSAKKGIAGKRKIRAKIKFWGLQIIRNFEKFYHFFSHLLKRIIRIDTPPIVPPLVKG
jgi:hypothetical protein